MMNRFYAVTGALAAALLIPAAPAVAEEPAVCHVRYQTYGDSLNFTGDIVITNTGKATLYGWTLKFSLSAGHTFRNGWEAKFVVIGQDVTGYSLEHNGEVAPGKSVWVGFNASGDVKGPRPVEFRINDQLCTTN
ncbi:hypothetical protein Areg01_65950 [Actinoplanes regularis]|nr:hypothetical protein Areg01_65950 [Actinoplanes regularis]